LRHGEEVLAGEQVCWAVVSVRRVARKAEIMCERRCMLGRCFDVGEDTRAESESARETAWIVDGCGTYHMRVVDLELQVPQKLVEALGKPLTRGSAVWGS
jgi:hypothetical protein